MHKAIVWQDRRTAAFCDQLKVQSGKGIQEKTGLIVDAYFSATKIRWILDNVPGARQRAQEADADLVLIAPTAVPPVCRIVRLKDFYRQKVAEYRASIAGKSDLDRRTSIGTAHATSVGAPHILRRAGP